MKTQEPGRPDMLTTQQVCSESGLSVSFLYKLWNDGKGPRRTSLSKKKIVVMREHYNEWLKKLTEESHGT